MYPRCRHCGIEHNIVDQEDGQPGDMCRDCKMARRRRHQVDRRFMPVPKPFIKDEGARRKAIERAVKRASTGHVSMTQALQDEGVI